MSFPLDDLARNDPTFVDDLIDSVATVWLVARMLCARGFDVTVPPLRIRERIEDMQEFADTGDLFIRQRVEVKRRKLAFTGREDYPYKTVMVDVAHAFDRAKPKPYGYVIVNAAGTHAAIVKADSSIAWQKMTKYDRAKNRERTFYECPLEFVTFVAITT